MDSGWRSARLETTYQAARSVLDGQRSVVADIDAKAMYTVRVDVVIAGVVIAAIRIGGPGVFREQFLAGGLTLLLLSMALGVLTYTESGLFLGPNRSHIHRLVYDDGENGSWEQDLCIRMGDWIDENQADLLMSGRLLLFAQLALLGGVAFLVGGVAL